ncbi:unnamed protein product, partial [Prorocentrum cordatum]
ERDEAIDAKNRLREQLSDAERTILEAPSGRQIMEVLRNAREAMGSNRRVFERLYKDALIRMQRLADAQERVTRTLARRTAHSIRDTLSQKAVDFPGFPARDLAVDEEGNLAGWGHDAPASAATSTFLNAEASVMTASTLDAGPSWQSLSGRARSGSPGSRSAQLPPLAAVDAPEPVFPDRDAESAGARSPPRCSTAPAGAAAQPGPSTPRRAANTVPTRDTGEKLDALIAALPSRLVVSVTPLPRTPNLPPDRSSVAAALGQ